MWIKTPCFRGPPITSLCYGKLFQTRISRNNIPQGRALFLGGCRGGFVAEHPRLLQTYVAKWPPKPVASPMFLIRCQISGTGHSQSAGPATEDVRALDRHLAGPRKSASGLRQVVSVGILSGRVDLREHDSRECGRSCSASLQS